MYETEVPAVRPEEVAGRVAEGWMLLDVRTDDEWAEGRIAGSVHIPMDQLPQRIDEVDDRPPVFAQLEPTARRGTVPQRSRS